MFNREDFNGDVKLKIVCIVMNLLGKPPLTRFSQLLNKEKRHFNEKLNEYISLLPEEWETKINADFISMCNDEIFNETFLPEKCLVIQS
jgi:hypothetical protein